MLGILKRSLALKVYLYALVAFAVLSTSAVLLIRTLINETHRANAVQHFEQRASYIAAEAARSEPETAAGQRRVHELGRILDAELVYFPWVHAKAYPDGLRRQPVVLDPESGLRPGL